MSVSWSGAPPSSKPYILNFPHCRFGAVSQSYLRCCLPGCSPHFAPKENLTHNSQIIYLFLVDNANRLLCHLISIWDDGQTPTSIKFTTKYGYLSILSANFECFLYF